MASINFGSKKPRHSHLVRTGSGVRGEVADLRADTEEAFRSIEAVTTRTHAVIVNSAYASQLTGTVPIPVDFGAVVGLAFSTNDLAFRQFKIPKSYVVNPSIHIHWTKNVDTNEQGHNVLWRVSYKVYNGASQDVSSVAAVVDVQDTYDDSGTTTRIVHRSADFALSGFVAGYYLGLRIGIATPTGTPLSSTPVLISLDLMMDELINVSFP